MKKLSCVEYQCTSSSILLSAFYFLSLPLQQSPVTPLANSVSSLSTLPLLFSLSHPCLSPVILFIPYFLPFYRGFPAIQVHTSQVSARPYAPLPSLSGVAVGTGKMDDRQGPMPASPLLFETPHTSCWLPINEYHTSLTQTVIIYIL